MPPRCSPSSSRLNLTAAASRQTALLVPFFLAPSLQPRRRSNLARDGSSFLASTLTRPPARRLLTTSSRTASSSTPSSSTSPSTSTTHSSRETIFALATATTTSTPSGIAIVRISGPLVPSLYFALTLTSSGRPYTALPAPARFVVRNIHHPSTRELLDSGAGLIYFPANRSYTTDPTLELHIHGGAATVRDVLDALASVQGLRMAEPGEFTRRAWESGRLSLTQVEALSELIGAETSVQRRLALYGSTEKQTLRFEAIRSALLTAMTSVEALIDFSEDGVEEGTLSTAVDSISGLAALLRSELGDGKAGKSVGEILTNGIRLAIYGPPNAGKSSLLNTLADRNAAIVSALPGTTRDVLEVHLDVNGFKVVVYDTAGIRDDAGDEVERIGIDRAREVVQSADLALLVLPCTQPLDPRMLLRPAGYTETDKDLVFFNKSDLAHPQPPDRVAWWSASLLTNIGVPELVQGLAQTIAQKYETSTSEAPLITQARHRTLLRQCLRHVEAFQGLVEGEQVDLVLAAEELRYAAREIGRVTGRGVSVDEILGGIFSNFCIGK